MSVSRTPAPFTAFREVRTFGSLDGLRAFSVLAVVLHHTTGFDSANWRILSRGFLGVDFFFEISGFLIVTLLLREQRLRGDISLRDFYARRALRIFPAYYLMLAVVAGFALRSGPYSLDLRHELPYALLYVSNMVIMTTMLSITWSLATEEQFYLVIPWLQKYVHRSMPLILGALCVLCALPALGLFPQVNMPGFFRQTTFCPILLGALLAQALESPRGFAILWRIAGNRWSTVVALIAVLLLANYPVDDIGGWPRLATQLAMVWLLAGCVIREDHRLAPLLRFAPLARLGTVSYGIYLYHLLAYAVIFKLLPRVGAPQKGIAAFVCTLLLVWVAAEVSFRYYERFFLVIKKRFSAPSTREVPA